MAVSLGAYGSVGSMLAAFQKPNNSDSAWRKLPDWSTSADVAANFADTVGTAAINHFQDLAKLKASQGLARIRALAAAKAKATQDAAQAKLQAAIDGFKSASTTTTTGAPGSVTYAGPQYGGLSSGASVSATPGSVTGPRFDFKV